MSIAKSFRLNISNSETLQANIVSPADETRSTHRPSRRSCRRHRDDQQSQQRTVNVHKIIIKLLQTRWKWMKKNGNKPKQTWSNRSLAISHWCGCSGSGREKERKKTSSTTWTRKMKVKRPSDAGRQTYKGGTAIYRQPRWQRRCEADENWATAVLVTFSLILRPWGIKFRMVLLDCTYLAPFRLYL